MWLVENFSTIVICLILAMVVTAIVYRMIKNKKEGKSSCGCGCESCAMKNHCHK